MAFKEYAYPFRARLKPSSQARWLLLALHLLAIATVLYAHIPWLVQAPLLLGVALHLIYQWYQQKRVTALCWRSDGLWDIQVGQRKYNDAIILGCSVVNRAVLFLQWRCDDSSRISSVVFSDALSHDEFRRLRIRLMIDGGKPVQGG